MTNATAVATANASRPQPRPTNDEPTHSPAPSTQCRVDAAPLEPLTALDFLDRMGDVATHWWSLIEHVFNLQVARQGKEQPLPEWASRILQDQGRHWISHDEFMAQRDNLREVPVVLAKDGLHTIPYEELATSRAKVQVLERERDSLLSIIEMQRVVGKARDA